MLTNVVIENYRSCLRTAFRCHPQISVLIGPNGSGKTNVLQALMLLNRMAHQDALRYRRDIRTAATSRLRVTFEGSPVKARLSASVESYSDDSNRDVVTASKQSLALQQAKKKPVRTPINLALAMHYGGEQGQIRFIDSRNRMFATYGGFSSDVPKIPAWAAGHIRKIAKFCDRIRYYGASQFTNPAACPVSFEIESDGEERRLHRLSGHARILYSMYSSWRDRGANKFGQFLDIVGPGGLGLIDKLTFKEVQASSVDYKVRVGGKVERRRRAQLLIIPQFKIRTQQFSPNQLSEGTFKTLALLFHVVTDESSALLIEEPEVCIHHGLLSSVLEIIKSYSNRKQMLVSTHSDHVLDHVSPENVFRVSLQSKAGTVVSPIRKTMTTDEYAALRHYLELQGNLGEYWREGGLEDLP